jgi:hypothetical protein
MQVPFHFRYQPSKLNQEYTNVTVPHPEVFIDCEHKTLDKYSKTSKHAASLENVLDENNSPEYVPWALIPNGKKEDF